MSCSPEKANPNPNSPLKKRPLSWSNLWLKNPKSLKQVFFTMHLQSDKKIGFDFSKIDQTLMLSDEILLQILSKLPKSQRNSNSLVCKRWLNLQGRLVRSLKVLDSEFLESGRFVSENYWLSDDVVDRGLRALASGCPNLRKLVIIAASELGLLSVAEECPTLQELELHKCSDNTLRAIAACENLQILKLIGNVDGLYCSLVSDIGLTILAQGCERLVKLELSGCEGSFDGIKAIGQCCQMLEELTLCDHRMDGGWLAALSYCENLKTLRFQSCKVIDQSPGPDEYLCSCPTLERLHLQKCQLRDRRSVRALFMVCETARELVIQDCWGLDNDMFKMARTCRNIKVISLGGCSKLTTEGLETVILSWNELQSLKVVSCKRIKDSEVSPALSTLFTLLKDLTWRPDIKSHLSSSLMGTGMGKKGGKFFKKS